MNKSFSIDEKKLFETSYIFIDGISRAGKAGVTPIVSSFENVEHFHDNFNIDRTVSLFEAGHLSIEGLRYFLESDLILDSWFKLLGRNLNMNKHDVSSVYNSKNPDIYEQRLETKDTPEIFEEIKRKIEKEKIIFPYATEELFTLAVEYPEIFQNIKFIAVLRHPIQTIFSWHRTNRGTRYGNDMRMPHPTFSDKDFKLIPSYALNRAKEYSKENGLGKCSMAMTSITKSYLNAVDLCEIPSMIFDFDTFTINPEPIMNQMSIFLGEEPTSFTSKALKDAQIPRNINSDLFHLKASAIFTNISEDIRSEVYEVSQNYELKFPDSPYKLNKLDSYLNDDYINIDFSDLVPKAKYEYGARKK